MIMPNIRKAAQDLYEYDGSKNIRVVRELNTYCYLVHFEDENKNKCSSIIYIDYSTNTANEFLCCSRDIEEKMIAEWEEGEEEAVVEDQQAEQPEYEIQSDNDTALAGFPYEYGEMLDNTDYDRWVDDHEGEVWEH